ncbi:hypothetical protein SEVIR_6G024300v4 [Setaria viridis]|uniref:DUF4220 domain-containing protein n=1 Tax=Setaria viridis TaxID=4556 RepID=A0A4U6U0V3_SETVI|nr:uncharacterized protein LOC117859963 [Setaria viridis]TKW08372.1 hypothetical protein SEVIR_6G024300v2 [Setaria viridis]TKW08373.1 hypothetical protein SEVIR_6G024300v2 [Setaria viridis]
MKSLIKLFNDWEIQLLVLLSFTLQLFLFFAGSLRRHWTNMFLRFSIWMAYLGADMVAVFALGYLSRHVGSTTAGRDTLGRAQPLAFFWAPFLLVHLGGQDTITAFSMEDNNLWLRHSLNMVVQVVLTTYILWMSIGRHNMQLLISGIFIFAAGVIKYGERIWSLKYGSMESLESSTGNQYMQQLARSVDVDAGYPRTVCTGLRSMPRVHQVFTSRSSDIDMDESRLDDDELFKLVGFELGMLHNDLYTKAVVLRTRTGIILRCISQITVIVAFVTFLVSGNKHSYHRADIAVTYSLFIGGFFLDFCAIFISLRSPWTWLWLKARGCNMLARFSWFLFSNDAIGWSEKRTLRSIVAGQYNLRGWLVHTEQPRSFFSPLMMTVRKSLTLCGAQEDKIFWLSKILGWEYAKGDKIVKHLQSKMYGRWYFAYATPRSVWNEYEKIMEYIQGFVGQPKNSELNDFGNMLVYMHIQTEAHLREDLFSDVESTVCRQLSRYMMYLLVTHPSLLALDTSAVATLDLWRAAANYKCSSYAGDFWERINPWSSSTEALQDLVDFWVWVIMYAAAKSRSEMHAALLARGSGELLTFVWLILAHLKWRDLSGLSWFRKMDHKEFNRTGVFGQG